jgi:flagellar brake protein
MQNLNEQTRVELLQSDDYAKYLLRGHREIQQVLQGLVESRTLVSANIAPGQQSFLTAVIQVDDENILIDASPDELINQKVGTAERLVCAGHVDKIRVQFALESPARFNMDGHPGFRAALPTEVLRLQRREFYRLQTPVTHTINCLIPVIQADGKRASVEARVLDISAGGVAVVVPPEGLQFSTNTEFTDCQLTLPGVGSIPVRLRVRNLFRLTNRNGIEMLRAGCEFVDLPGSADNAIQRYIFKVERDRSARERGTGL